MEFTEILRALRAEQLDCGSLHRIIGIMKNIAVLGPITLNLLFSKACPASQLQLSRDDSLLTEDFSLPVSGSALWYRTPAANWVFESLPIGNGYLGAAVFGGVENDTVVLNIDNLWEGGPFADPAYNGANWDQSEAPNLHERLAQLRQTVFQNGTAADLNNITSEAGKYGTFSSAGELYVTLPSASGGFSDYTRWLDMEKGVIRSKWAETNVTFRREYVCSYPDKVCSHMTSSSIPISDTSYSIKTTQGHSNFQQKCQDDSTLMLRAQAGLKNTGMLYEVMGTIKGTSGRNARIRCENGVITVTEATDIWFIWTGGTEYNIEAGTAAAGYTFKGPDPHASNLATLSSLGSTSYTSFVARHVDDYVRGTRQSFSLDLGQQLDWTRSTDELLVAYQNGKASGNMDGHASLIEWILFSYGRHLIFSSARGIVPANLQGVWSHGESAPWSGDYHANINVQMMYWPVEVTGMDITQTLWDFFEKTIVPRGTQTAQILYNVTRGWAMHDETNIFGSTGMKSLDIPNYNSAEWTNYAAAGAWIMIHVWDHFDYTGDLDWLRRQGYPLLKSTAEYWLDALQEDIYSHDGSLVVAPCNSPELPQTTFGCAHWQQVIWELFNAVDKAATMLNAQSEAAFITEMRATRAKLDRGLQIGTVGQIKEWKLDLDNSAHLNHRHLSLLTGLYPSYSISSFNPHSDGIMPANLTKEGLFEASKVTLIQRGNGTGPDGDAGWEKMLRAACWAQLGDAARFYDQLSYTVSRNYAPNLFSLYNPFKGPDDALFQMDANGGHAAAVLNTLIQAPDTPSLDDVLVISLLPALPVSWPNGHLHGARIRRGLEVDMDWARGVLTKAVLSAPRMPPGMKVKVALKGVDIPGTLTLERGRTLIIRVTPRGLFAIDTR